MLTQYYKLLNQYDIQFYQLPKNERSKDSVLHRFKHFGYHDCDVFTSHCPIPALVHYHHATEFRVVLEGTGIYLMIVDDQVCVIPVGPGDCITIPQTIPHAFSSEDQITFVRYFDNADYTAYCTSVLISQES